MRIMACKSLRCLLLLFVSLYLGGCATCIQLSNYRDLDPDNRITEIKPPEYILNKKKPKIAILPVEDVTEFKGALAKPADEAISQTLSSGTGLEIVERAQVSKLFEEAKFKSNLGGKMDYNFLTNLVDSVDFVVLGSVTSATVGTKFTEASTYKDQNGKTHRISPSCAFSSRALVNIRIVSAGNGSIYKAFEPFQGRISGSTEVRWASECRIQNPNQLAIRATIDAIDKARDDFMDAFPIYGYVSKTMTNPKDFRDRIAFISLGRVDGLKFGDKLILAKYEKRYDRIKNSESFVIRDLVEVEVNETGLSDKECLIRIPTEFSAEVIPGYIVKTKADRSAFKSFRKLRP